MKGPETFRSIEAFGGKVKIHASGDGVDDAVDEAVAVIIAVHDTLTRFDPKSELSRLNSDPMASVPVSPIMLRFLQAVKFAGESTGGLVDATCLDAVERSGYRHSMNQPDCSPGDSMTALDKAEATGHSPGSWRDVAVDALRSTVTRPPDLRLDAGGLGKGLAADLSADRLRHLDSFAVECLGELRFGGTAVGPRPVFVSSPDRGSSPVASLNILEGAIATSGITRRSWVDGNGRPSHHLIDPRTGEPAYSGVIQVTALGKSALEAEVRAKAALISGPEEAMGWLPDGGVVVLENRSVWLGKNFTATEDT